jgi:hypothetical protein
VNPAYGYILPYSSPSVPPLSNSGKQLTFLYSLERGGLYLWGAALAILPVVDLATDFLVLSEVWGAWPMWVVLTSVCAPFACGAYVLAKA